MKKIIKKIRYWRYRRLLRKLFWLYAMKTNDPVEAIIRVTEAFKWFSRPEDHEDAEFIIYWTFL